MEKLDENKLRYELYELSLELKLLQDKLSIMNYDERNDKIDYYLKHNEVEALEFYRTQLVERVEIAKSNIVVARKEL